MVVLACGATAFQQPRARRALTRRAAEEPDLAELKSLFEAQPRAPRADDDDAGDDDDDDDGDLGSLFAPPPEREVSAAERDAFVASLKLEDIVDEEYARARETIEETADAQRQEEAAEVRKALDAAVAEVEKSEREALEALEGRVGALVARPLLKWRRSSATRGRTSSRRAAPLSYYWRRRSSRPNPKEKY